MARTLFSLASPGPASGAISAPLTIDSTNGMQFVLDNNTLANADRYGLYLVVYNSAGSPYNCILRGSVSGALPDLTTACTNGVVTIIGPVNYRSYLNPTLDGSHPGLWIDFSSTSMAGTIMLVAANSLAIPANTAGNWVVKNLPGTLLGTVVTTLGTAVQTFYDSMSPPAGRQLAQISGSAPVGTMAATNIPAQQGIVAAAIASGPACTAFYA